MESNKLYLQKAISVLLLIAMFFSITSIGAFAEDKMKMSFIFTDENYAEQEILKKGDTVYLGVKLENYTPTISYGWRIRYDASVLDFNETYTKGSGRNAEFKDGVDCASSLAPSVTNAKEDQGYIICTLASDTAIPAEDLDENSVAFYLAFNVIDDGQAKVWFDTADGETFKWSTDASDGSAIPTELVEKTINAVSTGVNLSQNEVTVDGTNGAKVQAYAFNTDAVDVTDEVTWSVTTAEAECGVSIANDGTITIDAKAKAGPYDVTATSSEAFGDAGKAIATLWVSRTPSKVARIELKYWNADISVPADDKPSSTRQFDATVTDQYGDELEDPEVEWSISPACQGVSIAKDATGCGAVTVTNAAKNEITDTEGMEFTVTATCGKVQGSATITIKRDEAYAASVVIYRDGKAVTSNDTIAIPQSGSTTVEYSAEVLDQYGSRFKDQLVKWSSSDDTPDGVTVTGKSVAVPSGASTGSFTLTAEENDYITASITVDIVNIEFSGLSDAVTTAASPTYGMTWGEIVNIADSKISANVGGQPVEGTYSVKDAATIPAAGEDVEYQVLFTSNDGSYTDYVAYTGTVDIAPKSVTVSGITAENKEYDGSTNATIITDGATISDIIGNDAVTINAAGATGTFEDENVGTDKTVTISGIVLGGADKDNYKLTSDSATTTADITAKKLTADVSSVSVTKEYDGTTAAGTVSGAATAETGIIGETVTVNVSAGEYADKNVGTDKSVTLTLSLSGDNAGNYTLSNTTATATASITPSRSISDATATAQNVVVGVGTFTEPKFTGVTVNGVAETVEGTVTYTIDGTPNMTYEQAKAALAQKDKGSQIEVGYSFTSTDTNYVTTAQTGIITVSMVDIAFEIGEGAITVDNAPVYGATWGDIVKADGSRITAKVGEDTVTGTYTVKDASVRPGAGSASWEVLFTGTLGDKTYTDVTVQTGTVTVKQKELTITGLSAADKPYDGNTTATVSGTAVLNGVLAGDTVTVTTGTAAFDSENAGTQTVTFSGYGIEGESASNYVLSAQPASVTATISPKPVTITGVTAENKTYDGNTTATIANPGTINGIISPDTVTIKAGTGTFAGADVGTDITVTFSGFQLTGADSANYELSAQPASTTANIAKANYTGTPNTVNVNVLINQSAAQTGSVSLDQFFQTIPAGAVITSVAPASGSVMASVSVADGVVSYSSKANLETEGVKDTYSVTIETKNYNDIEATLTFTTVAKTPVNISGVSVTGAGKTYDGKAVSYTGTPAAKTNDGKTVTVTGTYSYVWQKADGTGLGSAPKDAGSYKLVITLDDPAYIGSAEVSFTIAKAKITITAEDAEAYTGSDMPKLSYTVTGLATGEKLAKEPSISCAADMKKAGSYVIAVSGAEVPNTNNYEETITYVSGTLEVKNRPVNIGPTYDIKVLDSAHGTVKASLGNASEGSTIRLTVTPDEGYSLANLIVRDERGRRIDVAKSGGVYRFVMPAGDVTIEAVFAQGTTVLPFTDVSTYDWFYEYVKYVYDNGIMDGIDVGVFGPGITTTRAMLVTMLYRVAGEPYVSGTNDFADVAANTWYTDAVTWASKNGIVTGVDVGVFNPNGAITREQLATILYRYAEYVGEDVSARASLSRFTDTGSISAYARDAMSWAVAEGILDGRTATELAPTGECTRAEVATMIARAFG